MELIANYKCTTGEGPLWHNSEKVLYWVDIPNGHLFRYDPTNNTHGRVFTGPPGSAIGGFTIQEDDTLLFFMERGRIVRWANGEIQTIIQEVDGEEDSRFNDVIAAPNGTVFCGTMPTDSHPGALYHLNLEGEITKVIDDVGISNGLGFSTDETVMYFTDSTARKIYAFDFDCDTSTISNGRTLIETPDDGTIPDGMTVDSEDHIWSARWDGYSLYRYNPTGGMEEKITFSTKKVSCPTFGGSDYNDLYVTTAGGHDTEENGNLAGALFKLNVGVRGKPEYLSKIAI
jgi:D-xylonolactonase|tara:strand:- start:288 stop:1148 length:861 start_codon:yes stop_codon:yes gene_type:complete